MIHYTESSFGFSFVRNESGEITGIDAGNGILSVPISQKEKESLVDDCIAFFSEDRTQREITKGIESLDELLEGLTL